MKSILAFGNPLLDVTISCENHALELIKKYNLKIDGQMEISRTEMEALNKDIQGSKRHLSPGGCCQNSLRVLQWILQKNGVASVFGSVGKDDEVDILTNALESEGVQAKYIPQEGLPTGKTVALIYGLTRTLVAHIGAAEVLPLKALLSHPNFTTLFDTSDIIFIEAFFLTNRFETAEHLVQLCQAKRKLLVFNLCGEYIFTVIPESIQHVVGHANVIFGNKAEYMALQHLLGYNSIEDMAKDLSGNSSKTLVITDGPRAVHCYTNNEIISLVPPTMNQSEIKDTTAAGDAFIGGFLAGLAIKKNIRDCLNLGFYAARNIIKQSGCSLPEYESEIQF